MCLPPEPIDDGWRYVDLELDPVLHLPDDRVEIEDWDEYHDACRSAQMSQEEATLARATAEQMAETLRHGGAGWLPLGWEFLADIGG